MPQFPQLEGDLHTDVLIIGGGVAGLLCAWNMTRAGIDCTLIEQNRIMHGVSGRTTAKITSQNGLIYGKLLKELGPERARMYWQANEDALAVYRELAKGNFSSQNNYIYATDGTEKLEAEMAAYDQLKIPARWESSLLLPFPVSGALCFANQAQFHPLKFASQISDGLSIYENTKAVSFLGNRIQTHKGTITAEKIIIATHFPFLNKHGAYFLKLYQQRSYVVALENAKELDGMYLDCAENGLSVRSEGKWLLLGGGGHRTGKKGLSWSVPEITAAKYYPQAQITARWATQDCMTLDGVPCIGRYSRRTPGLYVATGFNKWGMTSSMVAADILTDLVQEKQNPYADVFDPSRSILHPQLFLNAAESTINLLTPTVPRCPHMGCALKYNKAEHTWDCPCHGSRFSEDGEILDGPANKKL